MLIICVYRLWLLFILETVVHQNKSYVVFKNCFLSFKWFKEVLLSVCSPVWSEMLSSEIKSVLVIDV